MPQRRMSSSRVTSGRKISPSRSRTRPTSQSVRICNYVSEITNTNFTYEGINTYVGDQFPVWPTIQQADQTQPATA